MLCVCIEEFCSVGITALFTCVVCVLFTRHGVSRRQVVGKQGMCAN